MCSAAVTLLPYLQHVCSVFALQSQQHSELLELLQGGSCSSCKGMQLID
jgi:hypothetical protein